MLRVLRLTHDSGVKTSLDGSNLGFNSIHYLAGTLARFTERVHCYCL